MCNPIVIGVMMAAQAMMQVSEDRSAAKDMMQNAATEMEIENEARYNQESENNQKAALDKLEGRFFRGGGGDTSKYRPGC